MYTRFQKNTDEALAKYNLQVVDSMKKVQSINELKPEFILTPAEPNRQFVFLSNEYGKDILNITFKSVNTTTYNIDLTIYILATNEALYDTLTAL